MSRNKRRLGLISDQALAVAVYVNCNYSSRLFFSHLNTVGIMQAFTSASQHCCRQYRSAPVPGSRTLACRVTSTLQPVLDSLIHMKFVEMMSPFRSALFSAKVFDADGDVRSRSVHLDTLHVSSKYLIPT